MEPLTETGTFTVVENHLVQMAGAMDKVRTALRKLPSGSVPESIEQRVDQIINMLSQFTKHVSLLEDERKSLHALALTGQVTNSSLELDEVLQIVMDTIIRLTSAERGFLMLRSDNAEMSIRVARNWEKETIDPSEFAISKTIMNRVASEGLPLVTTNAQEDPRFTGQQSVVAYNLRSILCVPLNVKDNLIGVIYADNRIISGLFTQTDLEILYAFANQAAIAIDNARLFASVRQTLAEVTELKNLMENIFKSVASGVITADRMERVTSCNNAAEAILGNKEVNIVGMTLDDAFPPLVKLLEPYLKRVLQSDETIVGVEFNPSLPKRGRVDLRFNISPLKDAQQNTQGVAIVLDDLTERKNLEAKRRLFERMVSPAVIALLDSDSLQLGGRRQEITTIFADIRGFTTFSEGVSPEELVSVLNRHLATAADAVLFEDGTVDKFQGDSVMAWFNAPVPQPDHTIRAVRAALAIRSDLLSLHEVLPEESQLSFGIGIHVGDAVLGLIGTETRLDYTAIGDSVNTAKRIQENAGPGQILISEKVFSMVADHVVVKAVEPLQAKGKKDPLHVYSLQRLR